MLPDGQSVLCYHGDSSLEEAKWVASQIKKLQESGISYDDMTILYRAHYITRTIEEVLQKEEIPYTIYSGVQFFGRMEIKDALSYLRMIAFKDDLSFLRIVNVPKRNIGERRIRFLQEYAQQNRVSLYEALKESLRHPIMKGTKASDFVDLIESYAGIYEQQTISELLAKILDQSGYEKMLRTAGSQERLDNLAELKQSVYEYEISCGEESTLEHYLAHVALFSNSDAQDSAGKVKLMTVHAAKGLEFPYVFLCAMNEGIFPSKKTSDIDGMEEERRLAFVAMTRAQKGLYLSESEGRNFDGSMQYPSRFLLDIDESLLTYDRRPSDPLISDTIAYIRYSDRYLDGYLPKEGNFQIGDKIRHKIFGLGTILSVDSSQSAYLIQFDRMDTPRQISFRVHLEKVR